MKKKIYIKKAVWAVNFFPCKYSTIEGKKAQKPGEATEHTDDQLNKHLAANTEILSHETLSLSSDGRVAADCKKKRVHLEGCAGWAIVYMP